MAELNELIKAMTLKDLDKLKVTFKSNPSVLAEVDKYIEVKKQEEEQAQIKQTFIDQLKSFSAGLPHPADVHNVYMVWREVEEDDTSKPQVEVDIQVTPAVIDKDGKIITPAVMGKEKRYPKIKQERCIVELNKGFQVSKTVATTTTSTAKRAITVKKIEGESLKTTGNFPSASKACEYLKLTIGGDSAMRVLARNGYVTSAYDGNQFTS